MAISIPEGTLHSAQLFEILRKEIETLGARVAALEACHSTNIVQQFTPGQPVTSVGLKPFRNPGRRTGDKRRPGRHAPLPAHLADSPQVEIAEPVIS